MGDSEESTEADEWWRAAAVAGGGSEICFERRTGRIGDGYTGNGR